MINFLSYNVSLSPLKTFIKWTCVPCISAVSTVIWLYFCERKRCLNFEVLFYKPSIDNTCEKCLNNFSIDCSVVHCSNHKTKKIIHCILSARKSIDVCIFTISNEQISVAIIDAHKRGILIRIIISNCILLYSKEVKYFQKLGLIIKYQRDHQNSYMHNKFSIIDSKWLIHGSMNWTHQAVRGNWESVLITNSECLVKEFSKGFENIWLII